MRQYEVSCDDISKINLVHTLRLVVHLVKCLMERNSPLEEVTKLVATKFWDNRTKGSW